MNIQLLLEQQSDNEWMRKNHPNKVQILYKDLRSLEDWCEEMDIEYDNIGGGSLPFTFVEIPNGYDRLMVAFKYRAHD